MRNQKAVLFKSSWRSLFILSFSNVILHTVLIGTGAFNPESQEAYLEAFVSGLILFTIVFPLPILVFITVRGLIKRREHFNYFINTMNSFQVFMLLIHMIVVLKESINSL